MPDRTPPAADGIAPDADLLRRYLAGRDVACPSCRYNLRGCVGEACPECGAPIVLSVAARRQRWVPAMLGFLAFGWVLLAGILNTGRNARSVYDYASSAQTRAVSISIGRSFTFGQQPGGTVTLSPQTSVITIPGVNPTPPGFFGRSWSSVPWQSWGTLAWSVSLVVGGLVGLALLIRHRRHPLSERAWRFLRVHALALFGVYGGFHLYLFATQVFGW